MARHRFRGFGNPVGRAEIAGPLIGGGATQIGVMLAHLHARKNPKALRHAGLHGAVLGGLVGGALALSPKHRATGISALVTVGIICIPRILEGMMGLGHREETAMRGALGIITPEEYHALGADVGPDGAPVQLLGDLGTHVAEQYQPLGPYTDADPMTGNVEVLGNSGFGANFASQ